MRLFPSRTLRIATSLPMAALALLGVLHASVAAAEMRLSQAFESPALGSAMAYSIYLPAQRAEGARHPVVFLLHGTGDSERSYPRAGRVKQTMDALIDAGEIAPMIVVMPDAKRSWYVNSGDIGGPGDYETAIARDLIKHVDETYPTRRERGARFIAGHSMGGFGALRLAFKYPRRFGAVAGMSSALWDHVAPGYTLSKAEKRIFGGSFGTPFGAERFLRQRPRAFLGELVKCNCAPPIYLTSGDDDYFEAWDSTVRLFAELREAGLTAELRITDGGHDWALWRETALANVLRWFSSRLDEQAK